MTGETHRVYAICYTFIAAMILYVAGFMIYNYYLTLFMMVVIAPLGAKFPDYDVDPEYLPVKTVPARVLNTVIRLTGGRHRSWHTHSIGAFLIVCGAVWWLCFKVEPTEWFSHDDQLLLLAMSVSFLCGWMSHLFADMLQYKGVKFLFKKVIRIVPRRIGKLKFNTSGEWEQFNYTVINAANKWIGFIALVFPLIYSR